MRNELMKPENAVETMSNTTNEGLVIKDEMTKLPMWKKIAYGCGAGGGNVVSTLMATFLLAYYTDTAGIAAAAMGTMFVICRIIDAVCNFAMGGLIDNTHTKIGKARPWLLASAPLMVLGMVLILNVPMGWIESWKIVYAYATYIFLNCIVYTMFGIAHNALLTRMTRDSDDRTTTSTVSSILNNLSGLVIGSMITWMQLSFGWGWTSVILGVIAGALVLIPGVTIEEKVGMEVGGMNKRDEVPFSKQVPAVFRNRYFWTLLVLGVLVLFVNANAIGAQIYYCNIVLQDPMFMTVLMAVGQAPGIVVLFFMPWFSKRFSKRIFMAIGAVIMIIGFALVGLADTSRGLLLAGIILRSIGIGPMFAGLYAFAADAADYGEWKFGVRSEGLMASSQQVGSQIGIGFGSATTAWILAAAGYVGTATTQPEAVVTAIKFDSGWLGCIVSVLLLIGIMFLDVEKYLPEIRKTLGSLKTAAV